MHLGGPISFEIACAMARAGSNRLLPLLLLNVCVAYLGSLSGCAILKIPVICHFDQGKLD